MTLHKLSPTRYSAKTMSASRCMQPRNSERDFKLFILHQQENSKCDIYFENIITVLTVCVN